MIILVAMKGNKIWYISKQNTLTLNKDECILFRNIECARSYVIDNNLNNVYENYILFARWFNEAE